MKTAKKTLLLFFCIPIVALVIWVKKSYYVTSLEGGALPTDEGVSIYEVYNIVQSNADLFGTSEIIGFQANWGRLLFFVFERATSSNSLMEIAFDCERKMTISPLPQQVRCQGVTYFEFMKILEIAIEHLEHREHSQLGLLEAMLGDDGIHFILGWTNYNLGGSGISIWFQKINGKWQIVGGGPWIA